MNIIKKFISVFCLNLFVVVAVAQTPSRDLNYFLNHAHASSPILKDLENQRKSAEIDSLIIKATGKPQLTANGAGLYAPIIRGYGYDEVITNGQSLEGYLNLNYDLLNKKRINNQLESVKIQRDSLRYASRMSLYDLNRSITDQYLLVYGSQEQYDFNKEIVVLLEKEEILLKQLTRTNTYKQSEYLTFLVTLQQQQLALQQSELQLQNDYATLAYISGINDTTSTRLIQPKLDNEEMSVNRNFFLQKFSIDSLKNENLKQGINLNYKPKLGVYANGGYSSSLVLQPYKNFGASVGFTFSIPIYDGHQRKMQYDKLAISSNTISTYRDFFVNQHAQQLNLIRQQITQTDALFSKINEQIKFSKGLIDVDGKLLRTGDLRIADFVLAINNYMAAQNLFRQTTINRLKLINQYNYWNK
jgi:outer membrane protein TolC